MDLNIKTVNPDFHRQIVVFAKYAKGKPTLKFNCASNAAILRSIWTKLEIAVLSDSKSVFFWGKDDLDHKLTSDIIFDAGNEFLMHFYAGLHVNSMGSGKKFLRKPTWKSVTLLLAHPVCMYVL